MKALVCDRNPGPLRRFLEGEGHDVVAAYDAVEALRQIRYHWPDLVILDRETIGLEVIRAMQEEPWHEPIVVWVVVAPGDKNAAYQAYAMGADWALSLPLDAHDRAFLSARD